MLPKLKPLQKQIFAYIENSITTGIDIDIIVKEITERFPTYFIFNNVERDTQKELIEQLIWMYQYSLHRKDSKDIK